MMFFNTLGAIGVAFYVSGVVGTDPSGLVVDLGYVKYQGIYNSTSDINAWYGIRYAQPPTGQLRWKAPQDIESSSIYSNNVTINATEVGPSCVQGYPAWMAATDSTAVGDEDCLLLDILVPASPVSSNLPVMVQIHGGGYTVGSSETISPGNSLVYQSNGSLIYVSIQYRLGTYGFLGGTEVLANGVANAGLLDQRAALNWVQRHISRFGGDPSKRWWRLCYKQMILYGGMINPPFRAVVAEYPWWQPFHNNSVLQRQYNLLLNASSCGDLECLRSLPAIQLANAAAQTYVSGFNAGEYGFGDFYYGPYVDGFIIRDLPSQEFKSGHFTKVPLMTNREAYEGTNFSNQNITTMEQEDMDLQTLFPYAKQSFFNRLYELYPRSNFNSTFYQRAQLFGDFIISCPSYYMATAVSDLGIPVYKMIFDAGSQDHGSIGAFTETINLNGTSNNATIASILRSYYVSFATALDPNVHAYTDIPHPYWPTYQTNGQDNFSVLSVTYTEIDVAPDQDASAQCDFFHGQSYVVRN